MFSDEDASTNLRVIGQIADNIRETASKKEGYSVHSFIAAFW